MAHTPGPWEQHSEYPDRIVVNGSCVYEVRDMTTEDGPPCVKDVALMAAAPEILATLHIAADALDYAQAQVDSENDAHNLRVRLVQVKRVIAKAEGRAG